MTFSRRSLLKLGVAAGAAGWSAGRLSAEEKPLPSLEDIDRAAARPGLDVSSLKSPLVIRSMELLKNGKTYLVRVMTKDGAEGIGVANDARLSELYPVFLNRVAPFFIGKDARQLEPLLWDLYRHGSNYKLQGIGLWAPQAAAEIAILDLLGKAANKSVGELLGGVKRKEIAVYRASGNRGNTPEEEVEYLAKLLEETGGNAIKFRLGGRMSKNADSLPGRTEKLIPLVRKTFGDKVTLYADSNSSYDVPEAIRIGRIMEDNGYAFYEEPCRFDHFEDTKAVADALTIPVAGGEQEFSTYGFRWMIANRGVDVVQPDLHYYGGFLRCLEVARMADVAGIRCTLHMSGAGLGYLHVVHFASVVKDPGAHQEFKGLSGIPVSSDTSSLKPVKGMIQVPTSPGFGVEIDPAFVGKAEVVKG
jgi:L-alanine-DL-glutamate epimerase-like enolase superfamily enzyme